MGGNLSSQIPNLGAVSSNLAGDIAFALAHFHLAAMAWR